MFVQCPQRPPERMSVSLFLLLGLPPVVLFVGFFPPPFQVRRSGPSGMPAPSVGAPLQSPLVSLVVLRLLSRQVVFLMPFFLVAVPLLLRCLLPCSLLLSVSSIPFSVHQVLHGGFLLLCLLFFEAVVATLPVPCRSFLEVETAPNLLIAVLMFLTVFTSFKQFAPFLLAFFLISWPAEPFSSFPGRNPLV